MHFRPRTAHGLSRNPPPPPPPAAPRRPWRIRLLRLGVRLLVFGLLLAAVACAYLLFHSWSSPLLDRRIQAAWLEATGVALSYDKATFRLDRGTVEIRRPYLLDPRNDKPLLHVNRIKISAGLWQFFFSKPPYTIDLLEIESSLKVPLFWNEGRLMPGNPAGERLVALVREKLNELRRKPIRPTSLFGLQRVKIDDVSFHLAGQHDGRRQVLAQINEARVEGDFAGGTFPRQLRVDAKLNDQVTTRDLHLVLRPNAARQSCDLGLSLERITSLKDVPWPLPLDFNAEALKLTVRLAKVDGSRWALRGSALLDSLSLAGGGGMPTEDLGRAQARWDTTLDLAGRGLTITSASLASEVCSLQTSGSLTLSEPFPYQIHLSPLQAQGGMFTLIAEILGRGQQIQRTGEASLRLRGSLRGNLRQRVPEAVSGRIELDGFNLHSPALPPLDNVHLKAEMTSQTLEILSAQAVVEGMPLAFSGRIRGHGLRGEVQSADVKWNASGDLVSVTSMLKAGRAGGPSPELKLSGKVNGQGRIFVPEPLSSGLVSALERTRLEGNISLRDVTVTHPRLLEPIRKLKGEIEFIQNGREARLKRGSGEWMGVSVILSGSLKGSPLIWRQPLLNLSGAADFDLAKTRALLREASPAMRERMKDWLEVGGQADLDFKLKTPLERLEESAYDVTLNLTNLATDLPWTQANGPLRLKRAELALDPRQFKITQLSGRWGTLDLGLKGAFTPAGGDVRLAASGELAEVKRRVPISLKIFRVGGRADLDGTFTLKPRERFTPPATWQGWIDALRREAGPVDWRAWFARRWSIDGGGEIQGHDVEMTFNAMPARLWGFNGPVRFDMRRLWTPNPLTVRGGERSAGTATLELSYGTTPDDFLQGKPMTPALFNYAIRSGHLALEEWLRPWTFAHPGRPGGGATIPYDPKVAPMLKMHGEFAVPSAAYREVAIRNFLCQLDLDVTPGHYSNLFTFHDIAGQIGQGDFKVDGTLVNHDVVSDVALNAIDLAPFIKGLTGKEHVSGIFSGKLSGTMRVHEGAGDSPLEGEGQIRVVDSTFVSNKIFNSLFGLLKLPVLREVSFSKIEGPFQFRAGRMTTPGITFDNPTLLHLNAVGAYGPQNRLNMELQVQFLPKAVEKLPLVGEALKLMNKAIGQALKFNVRGTSENPIISPL